MRILLSLLGGLHSALYRATKGRIGGSMRKAPVLLLTTKGRKTGKVRTTPLLYGRDGENVVVVASVGGAPHHPAWFHNLKGHKAQVQIGKDQWKVKAREAEGQERERLWAQMVGIWPKYAEYQQKTTRRIPVVVLERASSPPAP
jgi:deazaflavin-dependent oxidoreductase (nitroreductase family)